MNQYTHLYLCVCECKRRKYYLLAAIQPSSSPDLAKFLGSEQRVLSSNNIMRLKLSSPYKTRSKRTVLLVQVFFLPSFSIFPLLAFYNFPSFLRCVSVRGSLSTCMNKRVTNIFRSFFTASVSVSLPRPQRAKDPSWPILVVVIAAVAVVLLGVAVRRGGGKRGLSIGRVDGRSEREKERKQAFLPPFLPSFCLPTAAAAAAVARARSRSFLVTLPRQPQ